jgi:diguanylate cyclase (GGDEF)-like protein
MRDRSPNTRHILVIEDDRGRRTISLEEMKYTLGRKTDNEIVLYSKQASRRHATLVKKGLDRGRYSYWILDGDLEGNKSHNGLYINGTKCLIHELKDGDLINFGCGINASYHMIAPVEESPPPPYTDRAIVTATNSGEEPLDEGVNSKLTLILSPVEVINLEDTIHDLGYLDPLTELPNRHLFNEYLAIALNNAYQHQKRTALLLIDIERFQKINDRLGHRIGDKLLQTLSIRIKECLRSGDITARWEGDKFIILLPQIKEETDLDAIIHRLVEKLQASYEIENHSLRLPTVIVSALYPRDAQDGKNLIQALESNLSQAKRDRQNNHEEQRKAIEQQHARVSKLEYFLHKALERQELSLYYQPRIHLLTKKIEGLEVLLRWQHPQYGTLAPERFLPVLEGTESIFILSHWVLQKACQQTIAWRAKGLCRVPVSINVSPRQLHDPRFPKTIARVLGETGLDANSLEIEMTETSFLENRAETYRIVHELHQIGVGLTLDDFGIGQSSIGYLNELPLQHLKIAQALVKTLGKTPQNTGLIRAAIAVGQAFNLSAIAEGVETSEQLETLQSLGCERIQGNFITSPISVAEMTDFLCVHRDLSGRLGGVKS